MAFSEETPVIYEPKPVWHRTATVGLQAAGVGAFVSALQNALGSHSHGAMGVLTRTGGTIGFFTAMGVTFAATDATISNIREKDDAVNGVVAGCAAGFLAGIRTRSLPMAVGSCAVLAAAVGTYDYSGKLAAENVESKAERRSRFFKDKRDTLTPVSA